ALRRASGRTRAMMTNPVRRITQGQFSFLPELTDAEISLQIDYGLARGYAWSIEYTDDPHPRNTYWEMFGMPMFELEDAAGVLLELQSCRRTFPQHYIRLVAFDATRGVESIVMCFIVNRPSREPGFGLIRQEGQGRNIRYTLDEDEAPVLASAAAWFHFDVMDNHHVPNLTIGPPVAAPLKPYLGRPQGGRAPLDVHLMVQPVDALVESFAAAGADLISFHPEASLHVDRTPQLIRTAGCKTGLAFNPATPLEVLEYVIDKVDLVLIMSVNPGFGGQSFLDAALLKLERARRLIDASGREIRLEVDGGIKIGNIQRAAAAGADTFVAGSAIFGCADY